MKRCLITAADSSYGYQALNLIGSIQQFDVGIDTIRLYDLGMTQAQLKLFVGIEGVEIIKVPAFVNHWRQCYTWKPWVMVDAAKQYQTVLYIDAGTEFVQTPQIIFEIIKKSGYFVVSQKDALPNGHTIEQIIPGEYYDQFGLSKKFKSSPVIAAGLVGFERDSKFYTDIITQWLKLNKAGYNLGWSETELVRNKGIHFIENPQIRDCEIFRHDQSIFNLLVYKTMPKITLQSMIRFGTMFKVDGKDQVMWSPKIAGSYSNLSKVKYSQYQTPRRLRNKSLGLLKTAKKKVSQ